MTAHSLDLIPKADQTGGWQFLLDAIERLSAARSLDEVIGVVRDNARILAGADGVCFVLREGDLCHYVDENAIGPLWKGRRFPMSACISGWCMLKGATAVIPNIYEDPRIPHEAYRKTFVQSLVMVPVRKEDPIAAIGVYWSFRHTPDPNPVALLEALARSTATALENASLVTSLQAELDHARERADELQRLMRELNHRVKNTLAVVQSIAYQTLRGALSLDSFAEDFTGRLLALSRCHDLLTVKTWTGAEMHELVTEILTPHHGSAILNKERLSAEGPAVLLAPKAAVALAMALQELATNSIKHGALSAPGGKVALAWSLAPEGGAQEGRLELGWVEQDGPRVAGPSRRGFGTRLLTGIAQELDGEAKLDFARQGFSYRLSFPLS